ncbi:hypothetical protein BKI52_32805 [marine bacterium AO1-C]|nr:hypothetical protein BKI52_32805 [marine bacterium AO1-C]
MKKIDKLVLKSFFGPFILTLSVLVFIFLVQQLLHYLDEFLGKGLSYLIFAELVFYFSLHIIPMVLPLAILLASLITFGNLGEHYELTAMKSSGISLIRVLVPIFMVVVMFAGVSFWFNNNIVPKANLNAYSLLYDIRQTKPALDIKEGAFYGGIPNYSIKVNHKYPDGRSLKDIIIYDHSDRRGNKQVTLADSGQMYTFDQGAYLAFELFKGKRYEQLKQREGVRPSEEFLKNDFDHIKMIFSLESFNMDTTDKNLFKSNKIMRNVNQLDEDIDSLVNYRENIESKTLKYISPYYLYHMRDRTIDTLLKKGTPLQKLTKTWNEPVDTARFTKTLAIIYRDAFNRASNVKTVVESRTKQWEHIIKERNIFAIEKQRKFTSAFACIIMFLIGAPLGAIIKKGGLGVPILISIIFFIVFYLLSMTGEKWAKDSIVEVEYGMWGANFILFWIGLFFLRQAKNDSRILEADMYLVYFDRLVARIKRLFKKRPKSNPEPVNN